MNRALVGNRRFFGRQVYLGGGFGGVYGTVYHSIIARRHNCSVFSHGTNPQIRYLCSARSGCYFELERNRSSH